MGLWFWKMLSGLRDCYFGGCLSSEEPFEFFWNVEAELSCYPNAGERSRKLANQPKVQCHQTSSHLHWQGCDLIKGHIWIIDQPFVDTLFFLLYYSWVLTCFCGKLVFDIVHSDIVHHGRTFAERTITQHGQSPEVIQVLYVHKSTCAQPRTLCWCVGFSSKLRPAKEASCRAKISNWWLVVVQLLEGFHGTMQNALHASEVCPAACRSCLPNLFLCLHG